MSKNTKILVGVLTILPFISIIAYIWAMIKMISEISNAGSAPDALAFSGFASMFIMIGITVLLSIGLLIYYIVHAVNNKSLTSEERLMWILLFVFISTIAFMIYWVLRIWQDKDERIESNKIYLDSEI
jgi:tellurite resistance protein TehA-like permease